MDPHSFAKPEFARVTHTHLELYVDFQRKVLKGKVILIISKKPPITEIVLDNYNLVIINVKNLDTKLYLTYNIGIHHIFGSPFIIQLPEGATVCSIQIEYETRPNSPALHWLTSEQTADGTHPFLLSNNKLTYARAVFPCQDTPSVKFNFLATISAPKDLQVLMPAIMTHVMETSSRVVYTFRQNIPIASYGLVIVVGSLQKVYLTDPRIFVWVEKKFINNMTTIAKIDKILNIAEELCGFYLWDIHNICVLPPSVSHFVIECPCVTFVSPSLLGGDFHWDSFIAWNISQSWAGGLVTCANFQHLWLNKSFSIFISRRIINKLLDNVIGIDKELKDVLERKGFIELRKMIQNYKDTGLLKSLLPNSMYLLPYDAIPYVPYEVGYILLDHLEHILGGPAVFEPFLKSYFTRFKFESITTDNWKLCLYEYFSHKTEVLDSVPWNMYFCDTVLPPYRSVSMPETANSIVLLAEQWINCDDDTNDFTSADILPFSDTWKKFFLKYLHVSSTTLSIEKIRNMSSIYQFDDGNAEIRFDWLRLCIKSRWKRKVRAALDFAIQFCSPNVACPIFQDLYEWPEMRLITILLYVSNKRKMLHETQQILKLILHLN